MTTFEVKFDFDQESHRELANALMKMPGLAEAIKDEDGPFYLEQDMHGHLTILNEEFAQAVCKSWAPEVKDVSAVKSVGFIMEDGKLRRIEFYGA